MGDSPKQCLLLVDDEPAHRKIARRALGASFPELKLLEASSIAEALGQLQTAAASLALAIVDLNLGGESGLEVIREIRRRPETAALPVIILSTSALEDDVSASYAAGADCYLVKAADPADYQREVQSAVKFMLSTGLKH